MTTTPAVAPLSADEMDSLEALAKEEKIEGYALMALKHNVVLALIAQARAARPKREMSPEMRAAIEEAHKTGATSALLPNGSPVFINYGHDYGDNDHLCCTACGGSGHIEDQKARAATVASVEDARDAARYRWLRKQHWSNGYFCVVRDPRKSVRLGMDCPNLELLDNAVDAAMFATQEGK